MTVFLYTYIDFFNLVIVDGKWEISPMLSVHHSTYCKHPQNQGNTDM